MGRILGRKHPAVHDKAYVGIRRVEVPYFHLSRTWVVAQV